MCVCVYIYIYGIFCFTVQKSGSFVFVGYESRSIRQGLLRLFVVAAC